MDDVEGLRLTLGNRLGTDDGMTLGALLGVVVGAPKHAESWMLSTPMASSVTASSKLARTWIY